MVRGPQLQLWVHHGPQQKNFKADLVRAWQPLGDQVRFVQSAKSGNNALDLHIAFSLGVARQEDLSAGRQAHYVVISGDKDFDALFGYLRSFGVRIDRAESIPDALKLAGAGVPVVAVKRIPAQLVKKVPKPAAAPVSALDSFAQRAELVRKNLREHPEARPGTLKKLQRHIDSVLGHKVDEAGIAKVIQLLEKKGALAFIGTKTAESSVITKVRFPRFCSPAALAPS